MVDETLAADIHALGGIMEPRPLQRRRATTSALRAHVRGHWRTERAKAAREQSRHKVEKLLAGAFDQCCHLRLAALCHEHLQQSSKAIPKPAGVLARHERLEGRLHSLGLAEAVELHQDAVERRKQELPVRCAHAVEFLLLPVRPLRDDGQELEGQATDHVRAHSSRHPQSAHASEELPWADAAATAHRPSARSIVPGRSRRRLLGCLAAARRRRRCRRLGARCSRGRRRRRLRSPGRRRPVCRWCHRRLGSSKPRFTPPGCIQPYGTAARLCQAVDQCSLRQCAEVSLIVLVLDRYFALLFELETTLDRLEQAAPSFLGAGLDPEAPEVPIQVHFEDEVVGRRHLSVHTCRFSAPAHGAHARARGDGQTPQRAVV
mmetsp:Transcript_109253/g.315714  ORF Transcript_109253/g.315714 Transcript_109253/m.315714 type:complete len:376 (+) Transcript_109253:602-1729(+)